VVWRAAQGTRDPQGWRKQPENEQWGRRGGTRAAARFLSRRAYGVVDNVGLSPLPVMGVGFGWEGVVSVSKVAWFSNLCYSVVVLWSTSVHLSVLRIFSSDAGHSGVR